MGAKVAAAFGTSTPKPQPHTWTLHRPAPGKTCIRSVRRQRRRTIEAQFLKYTGKPLSGRQWVRLRRAMRKNGMDMYALPTFVTR